MIVVDASVAVKWFAPGADYQAGLALLEGRERLVAPSLIQIEVTAGLVKRARRRLWTDQESRVQVASWLRLLASRSLLLTADEDDLPAAAELALELSHPVQDCLYLAVAVRLGVLLVTADRRFADRAVSRHPNVQLLGAPSAATH